MCVKAFQSHLTLCDPMVCSPPGSSVREIIQARILERVPIASSRGSSWPRDRTPVSCGSWIAGGFFTTEPPGKPLPGYWSSKIIYRLKFGSRTILHHQVEDLRRKIKGKIQLNSDFKESTVNFFPFFFPKSKQEIIYIGQRRKWDKTKCTVTQVKPRKRLLIK